VAEVMRNITHHNLKEMVQKYVDEDNAVLITDEHSGYASMKRIIEHIKIEHQKLYSYRGVNTNTIESFWAIIERGIMGQYHSVSAKMLPNYIAEFVYKYNNRHDNAGMFDKMIQKLLEPINL
jgi:ISXO2-like transposase domain